MNYKQEKCLEFLDDLVEEGIDITKLGKELPRNEYHQARKRMYRAFGTVKKALEAFGIHEVNAVPADYELYRCYYITEEYKVAVNEYERSIICDIYYISELEFVKISKHIVNALKKDAIDEFYRDNFPDGIKSSIVEQDGYKHLWSYIVSIYGSIGEMMDFYGTPSEIFVDYDFNGRSAEAIRKGRIFEMIVKDILIAIYDDVEYQSSFEGSRPDFVIGSKWLDAKLSVSALFHPNNTMIERYLKHTDDLTVIYAKYKRSPYERFRITITHISEYYPELEKVGRRDLIERCETFLEHLNDKEAATNEKEAVN